MSSLVGPPANSTSPGTLGQDEQRSDGVPVTTQSSQQAPAQPTQEQVQQDEVQNVLAQNTRQQFLVIGLPGGQQLYAEYGKLVPQSQFQGDYQGYIVNQQQLGASKVSSEPEFSSVDTTLSISDQVKFVQQEQSTLQSSQTTLDKTNPVAVGQFNAEVSAYNANVGTVQHEVANQNAVFQSYVGNPTPAKSLVQGFQQANIDVPSQLSALARSNPNVLVTLEPNYVEQYSSPIGPGLPPATSSEVQQGYVFKYQTPNTSIPAPSTSSTSGGIVGSIEGAGSTVFSYLTEGIGYAGYYLIGKQLYPVLHSGQQLPPPTPQQAQAVGTEGLEGGVIVGLGVVAPETLIGAAIGGGFAEITTGGKASPEQVLGNAAAGSVLAGVGYGVSLVALKGLGAYAAAGGPGADYVEGFLSSLSQPGATGALARAGFGAATNVALTAPFSQNPLQLAEAAGIGAGTGALLPGVLGTLKSETGLGGVEVEELSTSQVTDLGITQGKTAGELPSVYQSEPIESLGGKSLQVIGDVTVNPAPVSELEATYTNPDVGSLNLAHATLNPFYETSGEVLLTANPAEATGFRQEVESLGLYFAPSENPEVVRVYGGYIGIGEGYSGETPKIVLGGKPSVVSIESEVSGEFAPQSGESAQDVVSRTFGGELSGKVGIPVENYAEQLGLGVHSTERQVITPTAFKSSISGEEYPGTILETTGTKQGFYVKQEPEGLLGNIPGLRSLFSKYTFASVTTGRLKPVTGTAGLDTADLSDISAAASSTKGRGIVSVKSLSVPASTASLGVNSSVLSDSEVSDLASSSLSYYSQPISSPKSQGYSSPSISSDLGSPSTSEISVSPSTTSAPVSQTSTGFSPVDTSVYSLPSSPTSGPILPVLPNFPRKKVPQELNLKDAFGLRLVRNNLASTSKEINSALKREGILD